MSIKQFRPMTPGTRFRSISGFDEITRGRTRGTTARWKKAIVTLKEGDSIAVFEG